MAKKNKKEKRQRKGKEVIDLTSYISPEMLQADVDGSYTGVPGREKVLKSSVSRSFTKMSEFVMIIGIVFAIKMSLRGSYFTIMPVPNQ